MKPEPGARLSHYRLIEKIGEGGMGVVYRAHDERLRRDVALKILPPDLTANEGRRLRFLREARTAAAVTHPNIVTVYDVGEVDGVVFIAMEVVEGRTLRAHLGGRALPVRETLRLAVEMAEGLARAHQGRVVHRDLKPDNVIVGADGHVKMLDFGLARLGHEPEAAGSAELSRLDTLSRELTREGTVLGTPAYMSPEQARGRPVDARSDLFAFGVTLYEMVTGGPPFRGQTTTDTLSAILRDEPVPASQVNPEVPPDLDRIIGKCLQKDPAERYQDTRDLVVDLRHLRRATDSGAQRVLIPGGPVVVPERLPGRRRRLIILTGAVALVAVGGIAIWRPLRPAGQFHAGDGVIVADLENRTGRADLGVGVRDALEEMLAESGFIDVIRGDRLETLLAAHGRAKGAVTGRQDAGAICRTGGCAGYIAGEVDRDGNGFKLKAEIHHSRSRAPFAARSSVAASEEDLLPVIHVMALDLRRALGEAPQNLSDSEPPTTLSLAAYQAFAASNRSTRADEQLALLKRALEIDPGFGHAARALGTALSNSGDAKAARKVREDLYRGRAALPEKLRLKVELDFLADSYDFDGVFEKAKAYVQLYPSDGWGYDTLCFQSFYSADIEVTERYCREHYRLHPDHPGNLFLALRLQGKADEIERLVTSHSRRGGRFTGSLHLLWAHMIRGDDKRIRETVERVSRESVRQKMWMTTTFVDWLLASGRLTEASRLLPEAWRMLEEAGHLGAQCRSARIQAWFEMRSSGRVRGLQDDPCRLLREDLTQLPVLATFSVETQIEEPLAQLIEDHARSLKDSRSRYVREELQFARGCLALIRGETQKALAMLEPLARRSTSSSRYRVVGLAYERLGALRAAADQYEQALRNPHEKWDDGRFVIPAEQVLVQYRLARIYERLGDTERARHWYGRFAEDWKDADPDIPELVEGRRRLASLTVGEGVPP